MGNLTLVQVNSVNYGSTGGIMIHIGEMLKTQGGTCYYALPNSLENRKKSLAKVINIGTRFDRKIHRKLGKYFGLHGYFSIISTFIFLSTLNKIHPDIIHLHNLHIDYVNLPLLFGYLKRKKVIVVWTLHDCWAFTGQCPHFSAVGCTKWKTGCFACPQYREYPESKIDITKFMYKMKKNWFTGLSNVTLVTPSYWLARCVHDSFLSEYPVKVIANGVDLEVFKPVTSSFCAQNECEDKYVVLGVSLGWNYKKGLDIFIDLANILPDDFQIVLVGLSEEQKKQVPENCILLGPTTNVEELVSIYSAADIFLNPSKEETMGLVTVEALACGTPVIVSNLTAVPEIVTPECGIVVTEYSSEAFALEIRKKPKFSLEQCRKQAYKYEKQSKFKEYLDLYSSIAKISMKEEW